MKRYRVRLQQTVIEEAWVTVEAEDQDEALDLAEERAIDENVTWSFVECCGDIEAINAAEEP